MEKTPSAHPSSPAKPGVFSKLYRALTHFERSLGHLLLLLIRLYWGTLLVLVGLGKWMHLHDVAAFFESVGFSHPLFFTYVAASIEVLGGISLILGLLTPLFTALLVIFFICAYVFAHPIAMANLFINPQVFVKEEPFLFLLAALIILCFGPGLLSIDYWLERKYTRRQKRTK